MSGAKTEEPTTARLRKARAEGDAGASAYLAEALALVAVAAVFPGVVAAVGTRAAALLRDAIAGAALREPSVAFDAARAARDVVSGCGPVLACAAVAAIAASLLQSSGLLGKRRPGGSLGRIASRERAFTVVRALTGIAVVAWLAGRTLDARAADIVRTSGRLSYAAPVAARLALGLGWQVAIAGLVLGAADATVARLAWRRRHRMSRDEVRKERREAEGDPVAKQALERARAEGAARGEVASVTRASVVIFDGPRAACAVRYEAGDTAPVVVATGLGEGADAIVRRARAYGIPVAEDATLAAALAEVAAGGTIPEALYDAVADVFASALRAP